MHCKQPKKTINIKYFRYPVRSGKKILTCQNDDKSDKKNKTWEKLSSYFYLIESEAPKGQAPVLVSGKFSTIEILDIFQTWQLSILSWSIM